MIEKSSYSRNIDELKKQVLTLVKGQTEEEEEEGEKQ